jgi:hypothetical protein
VAAPAGSASVKLATTPVKEVPVTGVTALPVAVRAAAATEKVVVLALVLAPLASLTETLKVLPDSSSA